MAAKSTTSPEKFAYNKAYYAANRERLLQQERERQLARKAAGIKRVRPPLTPEQRAGQAAYYQANKERKLAYAKEYREKNREQLRESDRKYGKRDDVKARRRVRYAADPEKFRAQMRASVARHHERRRADGRAWGARNKERVSASNKAWHAAHPERAVASSRAYRETNREHLAALKKVYVKRKMAVDPSFKLRALLRTRLYIAIRTHERRGSAIRDLGCSVDELVIHIASQFKPGMTWENWGHVGSSVWHLDHIKPLAAFDLTDPEQVRAACHYTNLQPLWAPENLRKGARWAGA